MMMRFDISEPVLFRTTHEAAYPIIMLVNSLLYYCYWCAIATTAMMKTYSQVVCDSLLPPPRLCLAFRK
jgi:hypothetical protein